MLIVGIREALVQAAIASRICPGSQMTAALPLRPTGGSRGQTRRGIEAKSLRSPADTLIQRGSASLVPMVLQ
nr:hypothetical protein [Thiohalocapsa halophila]